MPIEAEKEIIFRTARNSVSSFYLSLFLPCYRAENFAIKSNTDNNSHHNFAKLSAWLLRRRLKWKIQITPL